MLNRIVIITLLITLTLLARSLPVYATDSYIYYGTGGPGPEFGSIDPVTGAVTVISQSVDAGNDFHFEDGRNSINKDHQHSFIRGLAHNTSDGELYALIRNHCPCEFEAPVIDPETGEQAVDPETGELMFGQPPGRGDPALLIMDPDTGNTKGFVNQNTGAVVGGMTYDAGSNQFYMTGTSFGNQMHTMDVSAGKTTELSNRMNHFVFAIAIHPETGVLYGIGKNAGRGSTQNLITIDKETGGVLDTIKTNLDLPGDSPGPTGVSVQALTFVPDGTMLAAVKSDAQASTDVLAGGDTLWEITVEGETRLINDNLGMTLNLETGEQEVRLVNALEYMLVPEPATAMLLTCLLGYICGRDRRRP